VATPSGITSAGAGSEYEEKSNLPLVYEKPLADNSSSRSNMTDEELRKWKAKLLNEVGPVSAHAGTTSDHIPKNPIQVRNYLSGTNQLFASVLDKRIVRFAASGEWDTSSGDQCFFLILRLNLAFIFLETRLHGMPQPPEEPPPDAGDATTLCWLLIDLWKVLGEGYLQLVADAAFNWRAGQPLSS
jgi:hypothetical protein